MSRVTVEVAPDATVPEGGRAILLFKGLATLAPEAVVCIDPVDDGLLSEAGWPKGEHEPIAVRNVIDGVEVVVGPSIVDAPLLQPGTPVTVRLPRTGVSADVLWPNVPVTNAPRRRPAVMTLERRNAAASAQAAAALAAATTPRDEEHALAHLAPYVAAGSDVPTANLAPPALPPLPTVAEAIGQSALGPDDMKASRPAAADPTVDAPVISAAAVATAAAIGTLTTPPADRAPATSDEIPTKPLFQKAAAASSPAVAEAARLPLAEPPAPPSLPVIALKPVPAKVSPPEAAPRPPSRVSWWPFAMAGAVTAALTAAFWLMPGENLLDVLRRGQAVGGTSALATAFAAGPVSPRGTSAASVDVDGALRLADGFLHGAGGVVDPMEARYWLTKSLELTVGDDQMKWALTQLGTLYATPPSGAPDIVTARQLWSIAAGNGDPIAMCFLAATHEKGLGTAPDPKAALTLYEQAKSRGGCKAADPAIARLRK